MLNDFCHGLEVIFSWIRVIFTQLFYYKSNIWSCVISSIYKFTYECWRFSKLGLLIIIWLDHLNYWSGFNRNDICITLCKSVLDDLVSNKVHLIDFIVHVTLFLAICQPMMVLSSPRSFILYFLANSFINVLKALIVFDVKKKSPTYTLIMLISFFICQIKILAHDVLI